MPVRVFDVKLKNIEPAAKFFLVAFAMSFGLKKTEPYFLKQLAEVLSISQKDVSKAVGQLLELSFLQREGVPKSAGKGKPRHVYMISQSVSDELTAMSAREPYHLSLVKYVIATSTIRAVKSDVKPNDLLAAGSEKARNSNSAFPVNKVIYLSLENRLLLAVLLSRADKFGVVRSLSDNALCELTGLNVTSLRQRRRKLISLGFIRYYAPGIANSIFAGKPKSNYILNLNHLQLAPTRDTVRVHVQDYMGEMDRYSFMNNVWNDCKRYRQGNYGFGYEPGVLALLCRVPEHGFKQLCFFMSDCVSRLLSQYLSETDGVKRQALLRSSTDLYKSVLYEQLKAFFRAFEIQMEKDFIVRSEVLISYFDQLIFTLTAECVGRFFKAGASFNKDDEFMLMPTDHSIEVMGLALLVANAEDRRSFSRLYSVNNPTWPPNNKVVREVDIPLDVRERSGLLALPS